MNNKIKNCIDCGRDISYKISNNTKRCPKCARYVESKKIYKKLGERSFAMGKVKHTVISIYSGSCAICKWKAIDKVIVIKNKKIWSYGCEIHHIEPICDGGTDHVDNLILLCPNHHKLADYGLITKEELKKSQVYYNREEYVLDAQSRAFDLLEKLF